MPSISDMSQIIKATLATNLLFAEYIQPYIRLCRMDFDIDARWKWCETIHNFYWHDATTTLGTSLGEAYHLLNSSLSRRNSGFLQGHANHASIIILLLGTTPHGNGKNNLYFFKKKNRGFQVSIKIAIEMDLDNDPHPYFH